MFRRSVLFVCCVMVFGLANRAAAQVGAGWTDRGYLNLNVGFESTSGTLNDATTSTVYGEAASIGVQHGTDSGSFFDLAVGTRVWRNVSVGVGFHRGSTSGEAAVEAVVPHPLFFNAPRAVAVGVGDLDRSEQAFHIMVGYLLPIAERLSVHVTAGPSIFRLRQDVVSDVTYQEQAFPFSNVTLAPTIAERSDSAAGGNIGVDVTYLAYDSDAYRIGGGVFIRYSGASAKITVLDSVVDSDVGGLQFGVGARVRF